MASPKREKARNLVLLISLLLFPVIQFYFSPYIPVETAARGILNGSLIVFGLLFLGGLFIGKAPCAWGMPCGALQECAARIQPQRVHPRARLVKWVIWSVWFGTVITLFILAGGIKSVQPLYKIENGISISQPWLFAIYYGILAVFLILSFTVGKRGACHTLCWIAPFMITGRKIGKKLRLPQLGIKANVARCIDCKACETSCPMSLDILQSIHTHGYINDGECNFCGVCIDACPKMVLTYRWGRVHGLKTWTAG